ncbi:MAG: aminotransferase class I/II-fold pyridoxal phosphate-dependent enzyme, partial [Eggerthellaceae bacterium]|nr:aminotransferase class I/II-fold pyridoxal phosphate-dependent enzyme [Eggerthellaceae bacterium]
KAKGLALNMARGKPSSQQLDLSLPLLDALDSSSILEADDGTDCRNYGVLEGLPEAREFMGAMMDENPANVFIYGASSLKMMYDMFAHYYLFGVLDKTPWCCLEDVKWLCPVPGYDRHFTITEAFGVEMINVPMLDGGPDMDMIEELVAKDRSIKGIWCVPKYANPTGTSYSDETVRRLASMRCAAPDFRIFWDNAYVVHHLYDDPAKQDQLLDIGEACQDAGYPNRYIKFASLSKITFPGASISAFGCSTPNMREAKKRLAAQTIGFDKLNQLRHVRYLKDMDGLAAHMSKHAAIIRPKFELVLEALEQGLEGTGCRWTNPRGGYFITFYGMPDTAMRIVALAKGAGVALTGAGAPFPYGDDPQDNVIRIAPTLPPLEELQQAMEVFVCCAKIACVEQLLA